MMKKKRAVFTIVKNEKYFLPIWLKYYKKYFDISDIYVLDHQSTDGSTENLDVNVVPVHNELVFDHQWLTDTVANFQHELLHKYECVTFTEIDELLYSPFEDLDKTLDRFIEDTSAEFISSIGYEVMQQLGVEQSLEETDQIFKHRKYFFRYPMYDKTLISKIPLRWGWGFHDYKFEYDDASGRGRPEVYRHDIHLMHLHRVDFELMLKRHERVKGWQFKDDGIAGTQHRLTQRDEVMQYFKNIPTTVQEIPQNHLDRFKGI